MYKLKTGKKTELILFIPPITEIQKLKENIHSSENKDKCQAEDGREREIQRETVLLELWMQNHLLILPVSIIFPAILHRVRLPCPNQDHQSGGIPLLPAAPGTSHS